MSWGLANNIPETLRECLQSGRLILPSVIVLAVLSGADEHLQAADHPPHISDTEIPELPVGGVEEARHLEMSGVKFRFGTSEGLEFLFEF